MQEVRHTLSYYILTVRWSYIVTSNCSHWASLPRQYFVSTPSMVLLQNPCDVAPTAVLQQQCVDVCWLDTQGNSYVARASCLAVWLGQTTAQFPEAGQGLHTDLWTQTS